MDKKPLTDDPEIAALLDFEPVVRKCKRHDGWTADNQRRYILGLAETGNPEQAAHPLGRTMSGAYKVRTSAGGESFGEAWDKALALHFRRNPRPPPKGRPSRGEILAGSGRAWPAAAPAPAPAPEDPAAEERAKEEAFDEILVKYLLKLDQERKARLAGKIVEADFYVRQLSWLEVVLDLAGHGPRLLMRLRRGGRHAGDIVATPMSVLLDSVRRAYWAEEGGPDRPPPAALGSHDEEVSTGLPMECQYSWERDGDEKQWRRRQVESQALAAEAQAAWEEKARKDAEAWAKREAPGDPSGRPLRRREAGEEP